MKNKLFISVAALGLLLGGLIGCNNNKSSEESKSSSAPASSQSSVRPSSSSVAPSSSSSSVAPSSSSQAPITQATVNQTVTPDSDNNGATIVWDAQDGNKEASSGFNSSGKFGSAGDYVQYVFESPMAMNARLFVKIANRSGQNDSSYNRSTQSGNQSIWYDYYNGPGWKYTATVNGAVIDQDAMAKYTIGEEEIEMKELTYSDFTTSTSSSTQFVAPWFEFKANQGKNVIRIERTQGYSVSVKEFQVIGRKEGAPALPPSSSSENPISSSSIAPSSSVEPSSSSSEPASSSSVIPVEEGYNVTFNPEHCKILVFEEGQDYSVTPVETNQTQTRDSDGKLCKYVAEDKELGIAEVKPQVNFKVVCDDNYVVDTTCIAISGTKGEEWNNLTSPAEGIFRITKIKADLTVNVVAKVASEDEAPGFEATFVLEHCSVIVYKGQTDEVDTAEKYYSMTAEGVYTKTDGQFNFKVVPENGYEFNSGVADNAQVGFADISFITPNYKNFKNLGEGKYRITKVSGDITITIACTAVAE